MSGTGGDGVHRPTLELVEPPEPEVPAGTEVRWSVRVCCPSGCDLASSHLTVATGNTDVGASVTWEEDDGGAALARVVARAPTEVGEVRWTVTLPATVAGEHAHEAATLTVVTRTVPHATSLAVWGVPSPVRGRPFSVWVGVKCREGCPLRGHGVEVRDDAGREVGTGALKRATRPGTDGLYEAEVTLAAPAQPGVFFLDAHFPTPEGEVPHEASQGTFSFRTLDPPEHVVRVRVLLAHEASLAGVEVRVGPYEAVTDERGAAEVGVASGTFELSVRRIDLEPVSRELRVTGDAEVELVASPRRRVDADEERLWM